jgi:RNA polymerase sigma-70 factor (ECF subfamily)
MRRREIGRPLPAAEAGESEADLVCGLRSGDRSSVLEFLNRTHYPVYCMSCRLTSDPDRRHDWTHDVLLGILDDVRGGRFVFTRPESFWAWFRKRAYFKLLDQYRRQVRRREQHEGDPADPVVLSDFTGSEDPAAELVRNETIAAIEGCLERIQSLRQRQALALLLFQELDYQDIASAMTASLNTVKSWIRRGRILLRRCLIQTLGMHATRANEGEGDKGAIGQALSG